MHALSRSRMLLLTRSRWSFVFFFLGVLTISIIRQRRGWPSILLLVGFILSLPRFLLPSAAILGANAHGGRRVCAAPLQHCRMKPAGLSTASRLHESHGQPLLAMAEPHTAAPSPNAPSHWMARSHNPGDDTSQDYRDRSMTTEFDSGAHGLRWHLLAAHLFRGLPS